MRNRYRLLLWLLVFCLGSCYSHNSQAQGIRLAGYVSDITSKQPIGGVKLYAVINNQRKPITSSNEQGHFTMDYPFASTAMLIEKSGYRTLTVSTQSGSKIDNENTFIIRLPLIPLGQQATDKPYLQSEQQDFTLDTENTGKQKVTRLFKIKDALSNKTIDSASICFHYTKVVKKVCKDINRKNPELVMLFEEADIISLEVDAPGYQTYRGNLILDKLDGSKRVYEVNMNPEVNIFTLNLSNAPSRASCILISATGEKITLSQGAANSYYSLVEPRDYTLKVVGDQGKVLHSEKINVQKGLNYHGTAVINKPLDAPEKPEVTATVTTKLPNKPAGPFPDSLQRLTLYFSQSDFKLLPASQHQLDLLLMWIKEPSSYKINIVGHTDNVGNPQRNQTLSEYRARVIFTYLLNHGVAKQHMQWSGMGGSSPVAENSTEENKSKNRRVVVTISQD